MAPSPAAGKKPQTPSTPTKQGKNPASSSTSKLGQGQKAAEDTQSATNTPKQAAGGAADKAKQAAGGGDTKSPKLPPRPKAGQGAQQGKGKPPKLDQKPLGDAKQSAEGAKGKAEDAADDADVDTDNPAGKANETGEDVSSAAGGEAEDVTGGAQETDSPDIETAEDTADETAEETADEAGGASGGLGGAASQAAGKAKDAAGDAADKAKDTTGADTDDVEDAAGDATDQAEGAAEDAAEDAQDTAEDAQDTAEDAAEDAEGAAEGAAEDVEDQAEEATDELPQPDLSILKGLEVGEGGEILDQNGNPIGQVEEGDPEDLVGRTIGDDGEILDEDGDVIGRVGVNPEKAQELADKAKEGLPGVNVLDGLEVGDDGQILGPDGLPLGKITDGNPEDLVGLTLNENGEILDEDGDVIGRAEVVPGEAADKLKEQAEGAGDVASGLKPDLSILQGRKVNKKGNILDEEGEPIGKLTEDSDPKKCAGKIPNEDGLIIDEDGNIVGKVEIVEGDAANEAMKQLHPELLEEAQDTAEDAAEGAEDAAEDQEIPGLPGLDVVEGLKVNKKGEVLNEDGEPIAKLVEGELSDVQGKKLNANGEVVDADGNVIGRVELIPEAFPEVAEAAELADLKQLEGLKVNKKGEVINMDGETVAKLSEGELDDVVGKKINEKGEIVDDEGNVVGKVELVEQAADVSDLKQLEGLKVNKKGEVVNMDGEPIARLVEGELDDAIGKKVNEKGEVLDDDGNVIGKVELIEQAGEGEEAPEGVDLSILEGYKVNKSGKVVNEDGETLASLVEGELEDCAGKKVNANGEILDDEGNVIGRVELEPPEGEPELPPLSILEGLKCNKNGKIVDAEGVPRGELIEGDAKKLAKSGAECDAEGQFWDGRGHVIGRAQTLPVSDGEEEAPFAGLEGLVVVEGGWVEDENQNRVGQLVEGDSTKLVGRAVDEDGDVIDKHGNIVGHAERISEEEAVVLDLSVLKNLPVNKQGNVIGPEGVPIGRLVEGNAKELAGKVCDDQGQIWNDQGQVVGRCEIIPENEREAKPEGPFAGLEGCVVVKDGYVEDEDGNVVGQVVEGDPKKLVGRAVDEDGDIIDKYGNVKGHAEPYEEPEEEIADLSSLEGKTVNKAGNVVDEHGTIFGRIAEGDPAELAGKKVDGQGQIWNDNGKVVGQAELIPGGGTQKPEGPFAGFENLVVAKDGLVVDAGGQVVGKLVEGSDPDQLLGRKVDEDGDILDGQGNPIGKAERFKEEEKERQINPMSGHKVNKDGEVRDENGELLGVVTDGHLPTLVGKEVDDNGYVIDNDGNKIGECTLLQNLPDEEDEGPTEEELQKQKDAELAKKMNGVVVQTIEKMQPICKDITEVCHPPLLFFHTSSLPNTSLPDYRALYANMISLAHRSRRAQTKRGAGRGRTRQASQTQDRRGQPHPARMQRRHPRNGPRRLHRTERKGPRCLGRGDEGGTPTCQFAQGIDVHDRDDD